MGIERHNGMQTAAGVKLCADCRWYQRADEMLGEGFDKCTAPQNVDPAKSLVRGSTVRVWNYCQGSRSSEMSGCGIAGRWFTPAPNTAELRDGLSPDPEDDTARLARVVEECKR